MAAVSSRTGAVSSVRRKQLVILTGLIVVIGVIALVAGMLGAPKKAPPPVAPESTRKAFGAPGENVDPAEFWRTQEGARVSELQRQLGELQARVAARDRQAEADKKREEEATARKAEEDKAKAARERADADRARQSGPPASGLPVQSAPLGSPGDLAGPGAGHERIKGIMRVDLSPAPAKAAGAAGPTSAKSAGASAGQTPPVAAPGDRTAETYIPPGAFMRGVLLAGLDAPTGGQVQQNPHPVVIEVLDMASLPNKFKADYKHCRLTANGVGDLSSERAYIRLDRLACIAESGGVIDMPIKGYIADQTGKAGVRGRLVSKQGSVLANALVAGVASGIGEAFSQGAMTTATSPLGSTQSVKDGQQFQAGIGKGVGNALEQLSKYYIQLAEKMFPIIEIDAGQPVDIVITQGLSVAQK